VKITINLDTENAAFHDNPGELNRVLETIPDKVKAALDQVKQEDRDTMCESVKLLDVNGNTVGDATVKGKLTDAKITVHYDHDPINPRDPSWNSRVGTMACWHKRHRLGDVQPSESLSEYKAELPDDAVILPIYMYEHGGITIATKPFSCMWDSGQLGIIWAVPTDEMDADTIKAVLKAEVEQYDWYLQGLVYGFMAHNDGEEDSCWGFDGDDENLIIENMLEHTPAWVTKDHLEEAFRNVK
jgi:hypothetical protein